MDAPLFRQLGLGDDLDHDTGGGSMPGKSSLTSRLAPAPQVVFRVADAEVARALGSAMAGGAAMRVQREAEGGRDGNGVAANAEAAVERAASSSGAPLPSTLQRQFEGSLGADLSGVRVHTGAESQAAAQAVGAKAYTVGQDIHFGAGRYAPEDPFGMHLLAHEVAHTVQQAGGAAHRQNKLEVSSPNDAAEHEADRAADAMVRGEATSVGNAMVLARKVFRDDVDTGSIQGAGDEAEQAAYKAPLSVDRVSVKADKSKVAEIIATIDKNDSLLSAAEKSDSRIASGYQPLATNATTKANLQVFDDSLGVTAVDTAGFATQFRIASADYKRLVAEGNEYLSHLGVDTASKSSIDTLTDGFGAMGKDSLKMGENQAGLQRYRAARANLNTAASKMDGEVKAARGAAQSLQGALYSAKAKAAAVTGKEAQEKLAAVKKEIEDVAKGAGLCIKAASAIAGVAGSTGSVGKVLDAGTGGAGEFGPTSDPTLAIAKGVYKDEGISGKIDPASLAETLVKFIGEQCNKEKIANLQQTIAKAGAEEKAFNAAADATAMLGHQSNMEAAAAKLKTLCMAYESAKKEMSDAGDALMAELNKGGKKGKDQAKGVLFLTDSDRFLAQVTNAITVGENQQSNVKNAAKQRKELRGTTNTIENEPDRATQKYYTCEKFTVPGKIYGTNDAYRLHAVDVAFDTGQYGTADGIVQGGQGSVEGGGGAAEGVVGKLKILEDAKKQVTALRDKIQNVLGTGGPGLNA